MLAIYARVSTQEQAAKGTSIETQVAECVEKAKGCGFSDWTVYADQGETAAQLDRPALSELRQAVAAGRVEAVIAYDPDRLSRKLAHQLLLAEEFRKLGARLLFVCAEHNTTPEGNMLFQIQGVIAEYEREKIRERTSRGRLAVAKRGQVLPMGAAPFGYSFNAGAGSLTVDPAEAEVVEQIYRWYVAEGLTMRQIGERLARFGVPARKGGRWHVSSVRRILRAEVYRGRLYYNQRRTQFTEGRTAAGNRKRRTFPRHRSEWVALEVPAIIGAELFRMAQARCDRNRVRAGAFSGGAPLLKGILVCGSCGHRWQVRAHGGQREYRCPQRYPRAFPAVRCESPALTADLGDQKVWDSVKKLLFSPAVEAEVVRTLESRLNGRLEAELAQLERARSRLLSERERLEWLFQQGLVGRDQGRHKIELVDQRLQDVAAEKSNLSRRVDSLAAVAGSPREIFGEYVAQLDEEGRNRLVRFLCTEATIRFDGVGVVIELAGPISSLSCLCSQHQKV